MYHLHNHFKQIVHNENNIPFGQQKSLMVHEKDHEEDDIYDQGSCNELQLILFH